jgi:hypothetical protein
MSLAAAERTHKSYDLSAPKLAANASSKRDGIIV